MKRQKMNTFFKGCLDITPLLLGVTFVASVFAGVMWTMMHDANKLANENISLPERFCGESITKFQYFEYQGFSIKVICSNGKTGIFKR